MIRSFFVDGIFGNVIRFIFDRFFGGIFTNNINFSNIINLKNCHFKDLTIDADKINSKLFKNSPFQLFSGHIGSFSIKFPSLNALLTESLEVRLDKLDIVLVMNDVDFSKAEQEINAQLAKNNTVENPLEANEEHNVGGSGAQDFDVYKKIINRILFNMKLKVENVCIRIVAEKPYKKVRLPIAPCFMLKIAKIEVKKNFEQGANAEPQKEMPSNMLFDKNQNYDIHIYGITLHMMANYELKPDEFLGKNVDPKAEFPFTYPTEAHPSTFFICACRKLKKSKTDDPAAIDQDAVEPISIRINFSNDRSKSVDINIPNIEIMIDFLKIKFLSRYVDKIMEWKKYMDYKKALQEQILSQRKSPQPGPMEGPHLQKLRKESFDLDGTQKKRLSEGKHPSFNNLEGNLMPNPNTAGTNSKIRIAGYDIDLNYFQKTNAPEGTPEEGEKPAKDMNLNLEGLSDLVSEPFELTADNILDTSNVHINLNVKSIYIYVLKTCSAFLEIEFRRRWLFGGDPQTDLHKSFNKKIPINYFQLKCTNLNLSMHTKDGSTTLSFNTFKILDVTKVETPLKLRSSNINSNPMPNTSGFTSGFKSQLQNPWNKSEVFHSFRMDKSMMTSGLKFPELKRNISSDPNESMLFQSAISDVTKDFLTMREVRKQIVDWDLDPKREHFCVNVIFKFNKARNMDFSKNKKDSESFKTVKYLDDSIIHSPLNTDPLTKEVPNAQSRPTLRFQAKGPKIVASLELPPVYVNFYMGIVHDINFLLHNASDSYKIMENWYLEQNQNLIRKWEQELREVAKQEDQQQPQPKEPASGSRRRESEAQERERIDEMIEAFYKRQNQLLSLDVTLIVPFIKIAVNLENTKKENNQCFCGFSSHYFADNLAYTPLFKKDFVITELYQLMIKVNKVPSSEYFYQNTKKIPALQTHVLFQNLDIYVPSKMKDENKVLMMKLLSVHPIQSEGKLIVPSITLTTYEDSNSVLVGKNTEPTSRKESSEPVSENRRKDSSKNKKGSDKIEEEEKKMDFGNKAYDNKKADSWATSQKIYCAYFQKHMNKHMAADLDYLKLLDENATASLKVTLPKFEVFVSKHTLEFLRSFSKDGLTLVEDLNTKLAQLIDQEKRLFTSFFETTKPQKVPPIANLSLYIEEISINLFQDEKVNQNFHQIVEAKNKFKRNVNFAESDVFLDASFSASRMERSFSAPPITPHISEMRCHYPEKDFERALESSVKIIFRQSEAIVYKNPKEFVETIHLEIHDLLVVDKLQEKPQFGSFQINLSEGLNEAVIEYLDEEKQHEAHECIIYKQSCWNSWSKPLSETRMLKEPEGFPDLKNKGILIIENPHVAFNFKNKNVLSLGVLKSIQEERQKVEIEARVGFLVFRSDLRFGFVDVLNDIASCFKQNPSEKKEENNNDHSVYSIEKREIHEEPSLSIQVSLENIMVDINPYVNFDYCKTFGKINFGIDPDSLDFDQQRDLLYYSDIRSLIALESFTLKLNKKGSKVQFDRFEISSLDVLLRQQKPDPNLKENKILLRSKEDSFFEREFEELTHLYGYKSHPVYLSGLSLVSLGEDMKKLELKLSKVELNLYADTIPTIEKHLHLILCLIEKRKQINNEQSDVIVEEQKESEREYNMMSSKQEGSGKPKDNVIVADEIEIDKEYFKPLDENLRSKQSIHIKNEDSEEKDYEDVLDEDDMQSVEVKVNNDSFETVNSMPSISTSYLSSSTIFYFDEENLHNFSLGNQVISKKLTFKIEEVCLRVFESYEFDSDPILMEIPLAPSEEISSSRSGESQTILMSHDQSKIEKLPKTVNVNEKSECIMVVLESFSMGLLLFNKNDELKTNLAWRASVMLENFEILDCFKNSKKGEAKVKLFSKYKQMSPTFRPMPLNSSHGSNIVKISNTFDAIFECFEHEKCQQKDLRAFVVIHPIEIYFGTPHYNFTKLFLAKMNLKSPAPQVKNSDEGIVQSKSLNYSGFQKPKRSSEIFISFFHIAPVELKMNLNLDISIINLDLFQNLTLSFPSLVIRGAEDSGDLKKEAIEFYTRRVKKQLGKFIKDLPILRNIKNLTSATFNIFYSPYLNYRESGNVLYGLKDGFFGFVGSVSNESANLFTFLTTMVDNAANLTGIRERLSGRPDSQQNQ